MAQNNAVPEACDCAKKWVSIGLIESIHRHFDYFNNFFGGGGGGGWVTELVSWGGRGGAGAL